MHAMKACRGIGVAAAILNLSSEWGWVSLKYIKPKFYKVCITESLSVNRTSEQKLCTVNFGTQVGAALDKNSLGQCTDFIIVSNVDVSYLYINFVV
jgi:hypothetical protein